VRIYIEHEEGLGRGAAEVEVKDRLLSPFKRGLDGQGDGEDRADRQHGEICEGREGWERESPEVEGRGEGYGRRGGAGVREQ
jgi:hypothetical protein